MLKSVLAGLPSELTDGLTLSQLRIITHYYKLYGNRDKDDKRTALSDLRRLLAQEAFKRPITVRRVVEGKRSYLDIDKTERLATIIFYARVIDVLYCIFWNTTRPTQEFKHLY